jgi:hypothetical protein
MDMKIFISLHMVSLYLVRHENGLELALKEEGKDLTPLIYRAEQNRLCVDPHRSAIQCSYEVLSHDYYPSEEISSWYWNDFDGTSSWHWNDLPKKMVHEYVMRHLEEEPAAVFNALRPFLSSDNFVYHRREEIFTLVVYENKDGIHVAKLEPGAEGNRSASYFPVQFDEVHGLLVGKNILDLMSSEILIVGACFRYFGLSEQMLQVVLESRPSQSRVLDNLKSSMCNTLYLRYAFLPSSRIPPIEAEPRRPRHSHEAQTG